MTFDDVEDIEYEKFDKQGLVKSTPASCSNANHVVSFRSGGIDGCYTCRVQW